MYLAENDGKLNGIINNKTYTIRPVQKKTFREGGPAQTFCYIRQSGWIQCTTASGWSVRQRIHCVRLGLGMREKTQWQQQNKKREQVFR